MTVGVVLLAHDNLARVTQVASYLSHQNVPVALHIDRRTCVPTPIRKQLDRLPGIKLIERRPTPWGSWALVDATMRGSRHLLKTQPKITHIALLSGNCIPIRPIGDLKTYLAEHPGRDYIQSVRTDAAGWVVGGLQEERFTYRFPVSFKKHRRLFDAFVSAQRRFPKPWLRQHPAGIKPCLGSQWWCLTRETLHAVLSDPDLPTLARYFKSVWIPDEAFFQTLVRKHSWAIEARSLTWAPFDKAGRATTLYDDHLGALRRASEEHFFARKVWPGADLLYRSCLSNAPTILIDKSKPSRQDETRPRLAPFRQEPPRIPKRSGVLGTKPYLVIYGAESLFVDLQGAMEMHGQGPWLGIQFENTKDKRVVTLGGVANSVAIARANPAAYLANLLRDQLGRPVIVVRPGVPTEAISAIIADPLAHVVAVAGGWCVQMQGDTNRSEAAFAQSQRAEAEILAPMKQKNCRAKIDLWSLEEAVCDPNSVLTSMGLPYSSDHLRDLSAVPEYLEKMRDAGLHPATVLSSVPTQISPSHSISAER